MNILIGEITTCQNIGCDVVFTKKTHNQIYHDAECTRLATNAKIMVKYYARRAQKLGLARYCTGCGNPLSRYNDENVCNSCVKRRELEKSMSVMNMLSTVIA